MEGIKGIPEDERETELGAALLTLMEGIKDERERQRHSSQLCFLSFI
jgi:hypothetical protein